MTKLFERLNMQNLFYALYTHRRYVFFLLFLTFASVYVGLLAWGEYSLEVLLSNKEQKNALQRQVDTLQDENAKLQKILFELKGLEP